MVKKINKTGTKLKIIYNTEYGEEIAFSTWLEQKDKLIVAKAVRKAYKQLKEYFYEDKVSFKHKACDDCYLIILNNFPDSNGLIWWFEKVYQYVGEELGE